MAMCLFIAIPIRGKNHLWKIEILEIFTLEGEVLVIIFINISTYHYVQVVSTPRTIVVEIHISYMVVVVGVGL